jgi:hypothetical protein
MFAVVHTILLKIIVAFARTKKEAALQMQYFGFEARYFGVWCGLVR